MALTRSIHKRLVLGFALALLTRCASAPSAHAPPVSFHNPQVRPDVPAITVLAPADAQLVPVVQQLRNELK